MNRSLLSCNQICIRRLGFIAGSTMKDRGNDNHMGEGNRYQVNLCEPCTLTVEVIVPYEWEDLKWWYYLRRLDVFDNRGIETQIWTNICDKYSSTGRWHAIPTRRTEIRKELKGRVHLFSASFIPIRCGLFEFTARTRAPKSDNHRWIWAGLFEMNESIQVSRTEMICHGFTQGRVRQLAQWFDSLLMYWSASKSSQNSHDHILYNPSYLPHSNAIVAYVAAFLAVIALCNGTEVVLSPVIQTNP